MISVALCTYNGERFLRQQLDSILSQSFQVDEIVAIDDCSTDKTNSILEDYALRFPQIKYIRNEKNIGFIRNFEKALEKCQGDFIFFSDQDDIWNKDKVKISVDYLKTTGKLGVFTDGLLIDHMGNKMGISLFEYQKLRPYIKLKLLDNHLFEILCLKGNFVTGATLAIQKSAKKYICPFRTATDILHDTWIALKLSSRNKLGYLDDALISYRIHPGQECGLAMDNLNNKDLLLDCFYNKGDINYLLARRRNCLGVIFYCELSHAERGKLFGTYKRLYYKNLNKCFPIYIYNVLKFYSLELYMNIRLKHLAICKRRNNV